MTVGRPRSNLPSPRRSLRIRAAYPWRSPRLNQSSTASRYQTRVHSLRHVNRRGRTQNNGISTTSLHSNVNNTASGCRRLYRLSRQSSHVKGVLKGQ